MNKKIILMFLLIAGTVFTSVRGQMAKQKDVKIGELLKHLDILYKKGDDASRAEFDKELLELSKSKDENLVTTAANVYEGIGEKDKAIALNKAILKRFPKGIKARAEAFKDVFQDENKNPSAQILEKRYHAWLAKYPVNSSEAKIAGLRHENAAAVTLANLYFKENNPVKAEIYVNQLKSAPDFSLFARMIVYGLIQDKKYDWALPILQEAYNRSIKATKSSDPKDKEGGDALAYGSIASSYAKVLVEVGNPQEAIIVLEEYLKLSPSAKSAPANIITLAKAYADQGRELDAFLALENFTANNGRVTDIVKDMQPLYSKLNNNKANFNTYLANVEAKTKEAMVSKYKSKMIKKEAPSFSLMDREGKIVSLSDYKGKIVVLDFWATWCGPCVSSFPGMQAAMNKYKDDKDVEFLFINTWQNEENYKELVDAFLTKNKYPFHVLFDEMKDRDKATVTAYGVSGIPHKVVIDKEGFIRFESAGGSSDVDMIVSDLEIKIELARKG